MAAGSKGRGPLVADRRYPPKRSASSGKAPPKKPTKKPATKSGGGGGSGGRKPPARRPASRRPRKPQRPRHSWPVRAIRFVLRMIWALVWRVTALVAMIVAGWTLYDYLNLPPASALMNGRTTGSVTMLDRYGQPFAWRGKTYGGITSIAQVSPYLKDAVIATEDKRFYHNFGVDPQGIASAMMINLRAGRGPFDGNGGSTITQQTAKLLCLGVKYDPKRWKTRAIYQNDCRSGGLWRKIKEVPYALAMNAKYSKNQILTIYFNHAYLGAGAQGFKAAAERYFGRSVKELTPAEAAMLAGLLQAPSYYAPTSSLRRAQARAAIIVGLMRQQGYLTRAQAAHALAHPAQLSPAAAKHAGGAFADWVMGETPSFLGTDTMEDVTIRTTLDPRIQAAAEQAVKEVFAKMARPHSKAQAAVVVMSPDGAVRAMVGGRNGPGIQAGAFNRATQALRSTGSSFKPFVYGTALEKGWSPLDYVEDTPLTIDIPGSGPWTPHNYEHDFEGLITLAKALRESRNIPAVRVAEAVGLPAVRAVARGFGLTHKLAQGPALALGASGETLLDMTGAYAGIRNGGYSVAPYGIDSLSLKGEKTPLIGKSGGKGKRVITERADRLLIWMMEQVVNEGTGQRAKLAGYQVAGKTGTTQDWRDAWFIGFTADYVTGVWIGKDDDTPMNGMTGGSLPAGIWHAVMTQAQKGLPPTPLPVDIPEPRLLPPGTTKGPNGELIGPANTPFTGPSAQGQTHTDPITAILERLLGRKS